MILDRCIRHQDCSHNRMCIKGACVGKCISIEISAEHSSFLHQVRCNVRIALKHNLGLLKFKSLEKHNNYVFIQRTMLLQKSH